MSKRWILVPVIIGMMAFGITTGPVLAQGGGDDEGLTSKSFAGRVADILGLDETTVQEAIQQVVTEARQDRMQARWPAEGNPFVDSPEVGPSVRGGSYGPRYPVVPSLPVFSFPNLYPERP